jgi:organic radical activating enzyme
MAIKLGRICIPFGMECNFSCSYCYRDECRRNVPARPTKDFLQYLSDLSPNDTYAVIASGGEPLIYLDRIKKVFSAVPKGIHKKIMTNGSLLTEDTVKWINDNDIEISLSHDGAATKDLRGYDIFEDYKLLSLCRQINNLVITSVITNKNEDVIEVYMYERGVLQRPFYFNPCVIEPTPVNQALCEGFDFDTYQRSYMEFLVAGIKPPVEWYKSFGFYPRCHINVLLDGTIIGTKTMNRYGTLWDSKEDIINTFKEVEQEHLKYCERSKCHYMGQCMQMVSVENGFECRAYKIEKDCQSVMNYEGVSKYVGN